MVGGPKGRLLGPLPKMLRFKTASLVGGRRFGWLLARTNPADLEYMARLVADGALDPHIERVYQLDQVPQALATQGAGHARGKKIIETSAGVR